MTSVNTLWANVGNIDYLVEGSNYSFRVEH